MAVAGPFGTGAAVRASGACARVVFPTMAGPLAGPVLAGGVVVAWRAWSRLISGRRVLARRPGHRRVLTKEIQAVKHGDA